MKRYWGLPIVGPASFHGVYKVDGDFEEGLGSISTKDAATKLTLQALSRKLLQSEGLANEGFDEEDDEVSLILFDETYEGEE